MENLRKNFLLGVNKEENKIYFGEITITTRNGYKEFAANFDVGEAFDISEVDFEDQCNDLWDCYDAQQKLDLLYDGDRTKEDVFDEWTRCEDYHNFIDCSCTDYETELNNGQEINFQTTYGGQHDIREDAEEYENIIFTNKEAVEIILKLWDKYHLKNIEDEAEEIEKQINFIIEKLDKYNQYEFKNIENFIKEHIEEV